MLFKIFFIYLVYINTNKMKKNKYPNGDPRNLRSLNEVYESLLNSYQKNLSPEYPDVRDLGLHLGRKLAR